MAEYFEKVLIDGYQGLYEETCEIGSEDFVGLGKSSPWRICKFTLKGGKQHGVDLVEIDNGCMTVVVVPTRGMGILEAYTDEVRLGWDSPVGQVVHPAYVSEESRGSIGWLEGFCELVCRGGLSYHGGASEDVIRDNTGAEMRVKLPLHGTIANTPAMTLRVRVQLEPPYELAVVGEVYDTQMFGPCYRLTSTVSTLPGSGEFTISDVVENLKGTPSEMELLYHCNFGRPILGKGARVVMPVRMACPLDARAQEGMATWDTFDGPTAGFVEQCYHFLLHGDEKGRTAVALVDPESKLAACMRYSVKELPAFTIWRNTAAEADGYVVGLEPSSDYTNPRAFERERGRVIVLPPGGKYNAKLSLGLVSGDEAVARLKGEIAKLAEGKECRISDVPLPEYCPM